MGKKERPTDTLSRSSPEKSRLMVVNKREGALCVELAVQRVIVIVATYLYHNVFYLRPSFLRNGWRCIILSEQRCRAVVLVVVVVVFIRGWVYAYHFNILVTWRIWIHDGKRQRDARCHIINKTWIRKLLGLHNDFCLNGSL